MMMIMLWWRWLWLDGLDGGMKWLKSLGGEKWDIVLYASDENLIFYRLESNHRAIDEMFVLETVDWREWSY